jgi:hypothetical protein
MCSFGYRCDREVGPLIWSALAGRSPNYGWGTRCAHAPVSTATALEMLAEVPGLAPIRGFRNRPAGISDAVAPRDPYRFLACIVQVPRGARGRYQSFDRAFARGVVAIDVRMVIECRWRGVKQGGCLHLRARRLAEGLRCALDERRQPLCRRTSLPSTQPLKGEIEDETSAQSARSRAVRPTPWRSGQAPRL